MGSNALPVPLPLERHDSNAADKWRKFLAAWENYALATELGGWKPQPVQVATLLTVIGEDGREVYSTFRDWAHEHMVEFHNNFMAEGTSTATVDDAWNKFKQAILRGVAKFVPHKTAWSTNKKPWISRETVRQIRQRNRAYQRQRRTRNQHDQDRYRDLKHKTQKKIRQDYWKYLEDIVTPSEGNNTRAANKKFWSFVKHTRQDSVGIPNLIDAQRDEHTTPQGKAQALNQQFASVFSDIRPSSLKDMASLLIRPMFPYMRPLCFKTAGISKLLGGLDNNKAPGPDGIHPRILSN